MQDQEDERRIKEFRGQIQEYYVQHYRTLQQQTRQYFLDNKEVENLTAHAGRGVIAILKGIIERGSLTSGYFRELASTELGRKYNLQQGEGLCFVDEYTVERSEGRFKIIPRMQELDALAREEFLKCQEAHITLHQRFIQNPLIPVQAFPGTAEHHAPATAKSVVEMYGTMKRRHTEIVVPVIFKQGNEIKQKLVALDLSSLECREVAFEGRKITDPLRCVEVIALDHKKYIACGFTNDYVLLDPYPFRVAGGHELSSESREAPLEKRTYRINSLVATGEKIIPSHSLYGLISIDSQTQEEQVWYAPQKGDGAVRNATVNPYDGNIYVIVGKSIKVFSPAGEPRKTFISPYSSDLESMVFDPENIYASSDRNRKGNSYILQARTDDAKKQAELAPLSSNIKGDLLEMKSFSREGNTHLLYANGGQIWLAQIKRNAPGNPTSLASPEKFHPHQRNITGNKGGVGGLAVGVHGYVSYGLADPRQPQALYEIDLRTKQHHLLYDFSQRKEYILPTIALLHTER